MFHITRFTLTFILIAIKIKMRIIHFKEEILLSISIGFGQQILSRCLSNDAPFFHLTIPVLNLLPPFCSGNNGTLTSKTCATRSMYFMSELFRTKRTEKERERERGGRRCWRPTSPTSDFAGRLTTAKVLP